MTGFIAIVQAIMIGYNMPDSPVEMLRDNKTYQAAEALELLYSKEDSERRLNELRVKIKRSVPSKYDTVSNPMNVCAMHLAFLRQFCGVTYLVVYASEIPIHKETSLGSAAIVIENSIQLVGGLLGIPLVVNCSRYKMVTISTIMLLFLNMLIGLSSVLVISTMGFASICVFMFVCGSALTSVTWSYPAELATPGIEKYAAVVSMAGTAIITIVPPFVSAAMPNGESYPIFFFFMLYLFVASILNTQLLPRDVIETESLEIELALGA
jgi:MFS family permease